MKVRLNTVDEPSVRVGRKVKELDVGPAGVGVGAVGTDGEYFAISGRIITSFTPTGQLVEAEVRLTRKEAEHIVTGWAEALAPIKGRR